MELKKKGGESNHFSTDRIFDHDPLEDRVGLRLVEPQGRVLVKARIAAARVCPLLSRRVELDVLHLDLA